MKNHIYHTSIKWTGNTGQGTSDYKSYLRDHEIAVPRKNIILGSSDAAFRGNPNKHNPEDLFLSSLSACHMLWYLHLCASHHIVVEEYEDAAEGIMIEEDTGKGHFKQVTLKPKVKIKDFQGIDLARDLHHEAHKYCFIANSVNFEIHIDPEIWA